MAASKKTFPDNLLANYQKGKATSEIQTEDPSRSTVHKSVTYQFVNLCQSKYTTTLHIKSTGRKGDQLQIDRFVHKINQCSKTNHTFKIIDRSSFTAARVSTFHWLSPSSRLPWSLDALEKVPNSSLQEGNEKLQILIVS